jgi:predicted PurR-regulated permease PerM
MTHPSDPGQGAWLWSAAKLLVLAAAIGAGALLVWQLAQVLLLLFGSVLVAMLLRSIAGPLTRHTSIPDRWSVVLAALLIAAGLVGFIVLLGAQIRLQGAALLEQLPDLAQAVEDQLGADALGRWLKQQQGTALDGRDLVVGVASHTTRVITVAAKVLVVLAAGVYLALSPGVYLNGIIKVVPTSRHDLARDTLAVLGRALRLWLHGQLAAMALVGTLVTLGLTLLNIPSALALGFMAGLFEFVPFVGPLASAIPAVTLGLVESPGKALWVAGLYVLIQQIEGMLILPLVQQRTVDLPPVLTIFAVLGFGVLFGPLGLLLATPLAVVCLVLVKKLWVREVLHEDVAVPGEAG